MDSKEEPSTFSEWSVTEMSPQEEISKKSLKRYKHLQIFKINIQTDHNHL